MPRNSDPRLSLRPNAIRAWRKLRKLSLEETAARMTEIGVKITRTSLSRIERQHQPYSQRNIEALAKVLDCAPADLIVSEAGEHDRLALHALIARLHAADRERLLRMVQALVP